MQTEMEEMLPPKMTKNRKKIQIELILIRRTHVKIKKIKLVG